MTDTIDTSKLDPVTLAKHLGNPEGEVGKAVTANLNKINATAYSAALTKLAVKGNDHVLEIGFGNGREIPRILSASQGASYVGVDISTTMVAEATAFNSSAIDQGRVRLFAGSSTTIPFEQDAFDKVLAINTIYFWNDPVADLREIRRVLLPTGLLVLGALPPWSVVGRPVFEHGFRFYEPQALQALLKDAGFAKTSVDVINEKIETPLGPPWDRDFMIVAAE